MVSDQEYKKQLDASKLPYTKPVELKDDGHGEHGEATEVPKGPPRPIAPPRPAIPRPAPAPTEPDPFRGDADGQGAAAIDPDDWPAWEGLNELPEEPFIPGRISINTTVLR